MWAQFLPDNVPDGGHPFWITANIWYKHNGPGWVVNVKPGYSAIINRQNPVPGFFEVENVISAHYFLVIRATPTQDPLLMKQTF